MIRGGGCPARATTQSENGHRPAKARDRPASAIRGALASASLCRFDRSQSFLTSHLTTDFGDNGRAAYRRSIDGGVTESLNDFSSVFRRSSSAPSLQACHEGRLLTQNCCPKLKRSGGIHLTCANARWTCPNMGSVIVQKRYALALRRRHTKETVREGDTDSDNPTVVSLGGQGKA
jgi:hypothetical protein